MDPVSKARADSNEKTVPKKVFGRPWPKGVSGNPAGRPSIRKRFQTEIYEEIYNDPEMRSRIKEQTFKTMSGKGMAGVLERREAADRTEGKVVQAVEMEVSGKLSLESVLEARKKAGK